MLKYELEREKLALELEEERRSHKERDQCIREQQMKIDNLSSLVISSGSDRNSSQDSVRQSFKEECNDSHNICQEDAFKTPCFKAIPNAFVVKRSSYSRLPDYSPFPDTFSNVADEDTWMKMNKGYIADLDSLQITPARKVQSFPSGDVTPGCSNDNYKREVQNLKMQLELAIQEKNELKRNHSEQVLLNNQLMGEISELQQEASLIREIPGRLCESVANCKDIYKDVMSIMQSFVADEKSSTTKLLSGTSEIGTIFFSTLETHFSMAMDGHRTFTGNDSLIQEQCKVLCERLNNTIRSLVLSEASTIEDKRVENSLCCCKYKGCTLGEEIACWKEKLGNELNAIKEKYQSLKQELDANNELLEVSKERYCRLEKEFHLLKEERDHLLQTVSKSTQKLALFTDQKEKDLKDLKNEVQRRKDLEEEIKQFSVVFASRQRSLLSFHSEFKSKFENLRAQNPVSIPNSLGC
ncbi:hypothetical protein L1049_026261 [Liquidambar formosana]|uniref:Uncharacterized protein n=1 Tax=Liquidambar formosana TaxID=63359 RepID=A0AAP0NGM2_LIQFO